MDAWFFFNPQGAETILLSSGLNWLPNLNMRPLLSRGVEQEGRTRKEWVINWFSYLQVKGEVCKHDLGSASIPVILERQVKLEC